MSLTFRPSIRRLTRGPPTVRTPGRDPSELGVFWLSDVCAIFHVMATNRRLRFRFEGIFICCFGVATLLGASNELGRIVLPANSSTQTANAGLQKLSGRNGLLYIPTDHAEPLPLLILLHKAGGSPSEWFSGSGSYAPYADRGHFIILAPESPGQSWVYWTERIGLRLYGDRSRLGRAFAGARSIAAGSPSATL